MPLAQAGRGAYIGTMQRASDTRPNILIVGAGPVGLTAAVELARRGIPARIIEKDTAPHRESRALAVNPRTLDILEPSGATERLLAAGRKVQALNVHGPEEMLFRLETRNIPHPSHRYMLVVPQEETEKRLIETLGGAGRVEWSTELTALTLEDGEAVAQVTHGGKTETLRPDIVIGADGAHSMVRKSLSFEFKGETYDTEWGLADVELSGLEEEELHVFDLSPLLIGFIPIRGDLFRVVADRPDVLNALPVRVRLKKVHWETSFRISHRQVDSYQKGPIFLAGDAAHIHSPLGGRGMNLGIEDAAWLAWLIERGETDRYTALRHPVAEQVIAQVNGATRIMSSDARLMTFLRRRMLPLLASSAFFQRRALRNVAGLDSPAPPWLEGANG